VFTPVLLVFTSWIHGSSRRRIGTQQVPAMSVGSTQ
jgi:hypothetical protein